MKKGGEMILYEIFVVHIARSIQKKKNPLNEEKKIGIHNFEKNIIYDRRNKNRTS